MSNLNAMSVKPSEALAALRAVWAMQMAGEQPVSTMLWGRPGIGKTQIIEQLGREMGATVYDVRLTTIDTSDLRGLPYYNHETKTTEWYRPEDLPDTDAPTILFLDELSSAPQHVQPTVYGLLQERRVGKHTLHRNTLIVAAGNGVADGAVAYEMGTAIANRLIHMQVVADAEDWIKNYATPNKLHPAVIAYIKTRPDMLENTLECMKAEQQVAATPRSWARVSTLMYNVADRTLQRILVAGSVGQNIAAEFMSIADDIAGSVKVDEMLKASREDRIKMVPVTLHGLHAMAFGLNGMVKRENLKAISELMADLSDTDSFLKKRTEREFRSMPLAEIAAYIAENFLNIAMNPKLNSEGVDMTEDLFKIPAFNDYFARHEAKIAGK